MILVDSVSGLSGARLEFDVWDLDVVLTSSQKAFGLPPGLAFCAVSDRGLEKAGTVANRGYYFNFVDLEKYFIAHIGDVQQHTLDELLATIDMFLRTL